MSLNHSEETHKNLVARIPESTGRAITEWFKTMEAGPSLLRFDERVAWLRSEHDLSHGQATAIVHEHDLQRSQRAFS